MNPQQFAHTVHPHQTAPEVQALAEILRIIEVPSQGPMPPIRIEFPEPLRVAQSLHDKGIRHTDPNALDPADRITEIVSALAHDGFDSAREVVALILRGYAAADAIKQVTNASVAHQEPSTDPFTITATSDPQP
ncbi:hypothetical protein IU500_12360 [Nocardia terpenica]|uniref:hypothetical protein n=1 Tax=Nocardia terpenica TaxID=455432 RepID=UPI001893088D|nr:hypothetical protein [Nocardia terpenica]MBF6063030.1 hypothetical protein [Nocardia terpenica]MBF6104835.1 hypothetical protein [Nocardia terpenica]MBF6112729.1 hypothetical protein [Nocardia terpenica]MBF6118563.1 hypothetical protein [Nocardia terpenica]MBF6155042.1 hypothetical protein [Nocardia terpenica]